MISMFILYMGLQIIDFSCITKILKFRVHHGRNPFCIDKNYGGVLVIWDRMFGTFASEWDHDEKVQYGLVHNINSFNFGVYLEKSKLTFYIF